jgi:hypothetical protein
MRGIYTRNIVEYVTTTKADCGAASRPLVFGSHLEVMLAEMMYNVNVMKRSWEWKLHHDFSTCSTLSKQFNMSRKCNHFHVAICIPQYLNHKDWDNVAFLSRRRPLVTFHLTSQSLHKPLS